MLSAAISFWILHSHTLTHTYTSTDTQNSLIKTKEHLYEMHGVQPTNTDLVIFFAGPEERFVAGAFDSLSAVELSNVIGTTIGVNLPSTLVFDHPSVSALAEYVHNHMYPPDSSDTAHRLIISPMNLQPIAFDRRAIQVGFVKHCAHCFLLKCNQKPVGSLTKRHYILMHRYR